MAWLHSGGGQDHLEGVKMAVDVFCIIGIFNLTQWRCSIWVFEVFCTKGLIFLTKYICYSKFKGLIRNPLSRCILPSTLILWPTLTALIMSTDQTWSSTKLGHTDGPFWEQSRWHKRASAADSTAWVLKNPFFIFIFVYRWVWKYTVFRFQTIDPSCQVQSCYLGSRNGWTWLVTPALPAIKGN